MGPRRDRYYTKYCWSSQVLKEAHFLRVVHTQDTPELLRQIQVRMATVPLLATSIKLTLAVARL